MVVISFQPSALKRGLTQRIGATQVTVKLPSSLPSGEYLFRVEHIALHSASAAGGAQFYISCGQINVTGGGSGNPGPLVAFPGAYKATDPGLMINIYYPIVGFTSYGLRSCRLIICVAYVVYASWTSSLEWLI